MTNVANPVDEEAFLRAYRGGMGWEELRRRFHAGHERLKQILTEWNEPERKPLAEGQAAAMYYTVELKDGREVRIRM